jgi:hypothetical protein
MKKLLLALCLFVQVSAYSQTLVNNGTTPQSVNLRLENNPAPARKGEGKLLAGGGLTVVGLGLGLIGPMLNKQPIDPTTQYLNEVRLAGNNTSAVNSITNRYREDYAEYTREIEDHKNQNDLFRILGTAIFTGGVVLNISAILDLTK